MPPPAEITTRDIADSLTLKPGHEPPPEPPGSVRAWWEWWITSYAPPDDYAPWHQDDIEAGFYAGFALALMEVTNLGARLYRSRRGPYGTAIDAWITAHSPKKGQ